MILLIWRNIRQFLNILPGILLLSTAACPILWNVEPSILSRKSTPLTWNIVVPIGATVGAFLNRRVAVKTIYFANGILLLICAYIHTTAIFSNFPKQTIFTVFGVIVPAFIYGVNHVTIILHAVDNSMIEIRGTIIRWVPYSLHFILLPAECILHGSFTINYTLVAVIYVILAVLVWILTYFLVQNSFMDALEKSQNESDIHHEMLKIRGQPNQTGRTFDDLNEMKLMLDEDKTYGSNILTNGNIKPLLLVIGARVLSVLFNNAFSIVLFLHQSTRLKSVNINVIIFSKFFIGWIAVILAGFNRLFYGAAIIWCVTIITAFPILILISSYDAQNLIGAFVWTIITGYLMIFLGIEAISYNQLSEAFPLNKRAWSIAVIKLIESVVQFVFSAYHLSSFDDPFLPVVGIVTISCYLLKVMPNTHGETLRRAREMFNDTIARDSLRRKHERTDIPLHSNW